MKIATKLGMILAASVSAYATTAAAEGELNLYSSRHYDTDERLYSDFTDLTGITINRIEGKADELIARMQAEGANSPADILLTVDTSRLERAKNAGVLQAIDSAVLEGAIPASMQDSDNQWFGFSQRARIFFYDKTDVANPPTTYVDLANLSGGGVAAHAPNKDNAVKFLEYLASAQAQEYFSAGNDEYPAVPGVGLSPSVAALGLFRPDAVDLSAVAYGAFSFDGL